MKVDHVSYSVPRPIHRPIHRSIYQSLLDRPSTDTRLTCQSTVDRESTDVSVELPLMSAEVSTVTISGAYRSTTGGISVNYRRNVGRVSFDSRARVYRYYLPIYRPILSVILDTHRYIAQYLILTSASTLLLMSYQVTTWIITVLFSLQYVLLLSILFLYYLITSWYVNR